MEERQLNKWVDFATEIKQIEDKYGKHYYQGHPDLPPHEPSILYRGYANASWKLETTLERKSPDKTWDVLSYSKKINRCAPMLQSFTDKDWRVSRHDLAQEVVAKYDDSEPIQSILNYDYWAYLRHHGFPSPLLDWTQSAYVAAYFAFADATNLHDRVAVMVFIEMPEGSKGGFVGAPVITPIGPLVATHRRHFLQQSCYTIATQPDDTNQVHKFVSHEAVQRPEDGSQDLLIKITLPVSERQTALDALGAMNINHFSLFQSEDALARTLGYQVIERV